MNIPSLTLPQRPWRLIIAGLISVFILASCTMKSLYLQLDWIIPQFIDEYIPLNDKQAQMLRLSLQKTLEWHRTTQLPAYIHWLRTFRENVRTGLSRADVIQHSEQLEQFWKTLLNYISDIDLRRTIQKTQNKNEAFNSFVDWLSFGNENIAENDRHEQLKIIKYNHLIANNVIFYNVFHMSIILQKLQLESYEITDDILRIEPRYGQK